jgi:hypothetical protein
MNTEKISAPEAEATGAPKGRSADILYAEDRFPNRGCFARTSGPGDVAFLPPAGSPAEPSETGPGGGSPRPPRRVRYAALSVALFAAYLCIVYVLGLVAAQFDGIVYVLLKVFQVSNAVSGLWVSLITWRYIRHDCGISRYPTVGYPARRWND